MVMTPDDLGRAITIATLAHDLAENNKDKAGQPYILHPLRVMFSMFTLDEKIVAVLHDVAEDTAVTLSDLEQQFSAHIIEALQRLTHIPGESYEEYILHIKRGPSLAVRVKLADLRDNMNKDRIPFPSERDRKRWEKYERAYEVLTS